MASGIAFSVVESGLHLLQALNQIDVIRAVGISVVKCAVGFHQTENVHPGHRIVLADGQVLLEAESVESDAVVVTLMCDTGMKYLSTDSFRIYTSGGGR